MTTVSATFEFPGNITSFDWREDGTGMAFLIDATGSGTGTNQLGGYYYLPDTAETASHAALLPALEQAVTYQNVTTQAQLDKLGAEEASIRQSPVTTPELHVRADMEPRPGSYRVGQHVRVRINNSPRFPISIYPNGYDAIWRITQIKYQPQGTQDEDVVIDLAQFSDSIPPS